MNEKSPPAPTGARHSGKTSICLTLSHAISLVACIVAIGGSAYSTSQARGDEKTIMIGTFVAAFWTLGVDISELAALLDREGKLKMMKKIPRCPVRFLYLLELVTAVFCFGLPAASMLAQSEARYQRCRYVSSGDRARLGCDYGVVDEKTYVPQMVGFGTIYLVA